MSSLKKMIDGAAGLIGRRPQPPAPKLPEAPAEFDAADVEIFRYVLDSGLTMVSEERLIATMLACKHVTEAGIPGDFVECGVWRGGNAIAAADVLQRAGDGRKAWLYDTFAGMTDPSEADVDWKGRPARARFEKRQREGYNAWCYASLEDVQANVDQAPRRLDNTVFVQGDVLETLGDPARLPESIAVLRLDTDWYESNKIGLEALYPRLSLGGALVIDDYGHWGGVKKAVDEYFETVPRPFLAYTDYAGRIAIKRE